MVCLVIVECNPQTEVEVQVLRDRISRTKSIDLDNDVSKMLEHIASTIELITDQEETRDSLMKYTLNTLLTVPNAQNHQFFALEKLSW